MKKAYEKNSKDRIDRQEKVDKKIRNESKSETEFENTKIRINELDNIKSDKAKRNLFELKNLTSDKLEKRRMDDLILSTTSFRNEKDNNISSVLPVEYKLSQNFPNPFNPITTINFSIPNQGNVVLKVYDVKGKEVKT
ncbi:MAG TPA: hypothetical protein PKC58_16990, partial [Ignavibacteria bacterium]|nr:hypothetical protein [Ignavibacteria bacterium]